MEQLLLRRKSVVSSVVVGAFGSGGNPTSGMGGKLVKAAVDPEQYEVASRTIMFMGFMTLVFWHKLIQDLGFWEQFLGRDRLV